MLVDIGFDEGALRDDLQALGPNLIQRALYQRRAGAFAAEFRRNFGVDEGDDAIGDTVVGRGEMAFDHEFVAMLRLVVDDLSHENSCLRLQISGLQICPAETIKPSRSRPLFKDTPMKLVLSLLGVVLLVVAAVYFLMPADQLPSFLPGHEAGVMRVHSKHGIVAGAAGIVLLVAGWWIGRR